MHLLLYSHSTTFKIFEYKVVKKWKGFKCNATVSSPVRCNAALSRTCASETCLNFKSFPLQNHHRHNAHIQQWAPHHSSVMSGQVMVWTLKKQQQILSQAASIKLLYSNSSLICHLTLQHIIIPNEGGILITVSKFCGTCVKVKL